MQGDTTLENVVGFVLMNIKSSSSNTTVFKGLSQSRFVNETATGSVDQKGSRSHLLNRVLVDKVMIVFVQGAVK